MLGKIRDAIATGNGSPEHYWRQVAASAITLLGDYTWIHRIVESVEFLDESRVRRQVSVDLTLPPGLVRTRRGAAVVPLLVASKKVITALDLRGPDGATLPVLTRREHGLLATQILLIQAERKLRRSPREPVVRALEAVALIGPSRDDPASTADAQLAVIRGGLNRRDRREFDGLEPDVWISMFAGSFALAAVVDVRSGERTVLKVRYEEEFWADSGFAVFNASAFFGASSYHIEILAPEDMIITDSELVVLAAEQRHSGLVPVAREVVDSRSRVDRAHLYGRQDDVHAANLEGAAACFAFAWLRLRPYVIYPVFFISLFTDGVFVVGALAHRAHWTEDAGTAGALVIALPGLFAAYFAPSGHRLPRRLLLSVRASAYASAALSFAAAGVIVVAPPDEVWRWPKSAGLSAAGVAVALVAYLVLITAQILATRCGNRVRAGRTGRLWPYFAAPRAWRQASGLLAAVAATLLGLRVGSVIGGAGHAYAPQAWIWAALGLLSLAVTIQLGVVLAQSVWCSRRVPARGPASEG